MARNRRNMRAGFSLVEVIISALILSILFMALAGAFNSNLLAVSTAKELTEGATFLETTLESLSAQDYDNLLAMNGNQFFDRTDAVDSRFAVNLTVTESAVDLLQVRAILIDLGNNMELARVLTHRSRR